MDLWSRFVSSNFLCTVELTFLMVWMLVDTGVV